MLFSFSLKKKILLLIKYHGSLMYLLDINPHILTKKESWVSVCKLKDEVMQISVFKVTMCEGKVVLWLTICHLLISRTVKKKKATFTHHAWPWMALLHWQNANHLSQWKISGGPRSSRANLSTVWAAWLNKWFALLLSISQMGTISSPKWNLPYF